MPISNFTTHKDKPLFLMILYFITCLSFIFFLKSIPLKSLPPWASEIRLLSLLFPFSELIKNKLGCSYFPRIPPKISAKMKTKTSEKDSVLEAAEMSVLDLPELALECILERLPPAGLSSMAAVCTSLRDRCRKDHLWERHMKEKWGRLIGPAAYREWQWHIASKDFGNSKLVKRKGLMRILSLVWPFSRNQSNVDTTKNHMSSLPVDSIMSCYIALETGRFLFPAQVYNRENGHVGFMLSCYDAELSYDPCTDTFRARYPPHGRRAISIENGVTWDRLRAPPVDTPAHDLHISDCLNELRPGDHIEIQWRRNKEFPYGWWYGVVGHLESCDGRNNCLCHNNDRVVLEFNQYTPGSRWRHATINRRDHREEGNEADGFYGGIRKLNNNIEISTWKHLWPTAVLE